MAQNIIKGNPRLCSGCASVDLPAFFRKHEKSLKIVPVPDSESRKCDLCDFVSSCFRVKGISYEPLDMSYYLLDMPLTLDSSDHLGVIRHGLPFGSLEDGSSLCYVNLHAPKVYGGHACIMRLPPSRTSLAWATSPKIDWRTVRTWFRNDTTPTDGKLSSGNSSRLLVIECRTRTLVLIDEEIKYVTLSYVWGSLPATESVKCAVNGLLPELPCTIQDSIIVCLELGYQFLWVDRYCIPQDDTAQRHQQIQRMDAIYTNSALTIVACAGSSPQYGLPGVTTSRQNLPSLNLEQSGYLQMIPSVWDIRFSAWAQRAWTYQETLLSNTRLYFTDAQLYFESPRDVSCEWSILSENMPSSIGPVDWIYSQSTWLSYPADIYKCIQKYTNRTLSFEGDALNAFLGILAAYERQFGVYHMWGMPYLKLDRAASALPTMTHSLFFDLTGKSVRRTEFPSWAWTGWTHLVDWIDISYNNWLMDCGIAVQLRSGSLVSWNEYSASYDFYAQNSEMLSRFIHLQGYLILIRSVRRVPGTYGNVDMEIDSANEMSLSYIERERRLRLPERIIGQSLEGYALWRPASLVPRWESTANYSDTWGIPHLLIRNVGEHWERVANVTFRSEYKDRNGETIEDQNLWPGHLQTIRLG